MYEARPAPAALRHGFTTLASWNPGGEPWTGVLPADPGFEVVWTRQGDLIVQPPILTPAKRTPRLVSSAGATGETRILRLRPTAVGAWLGREAAELVDGGAIPLGQLGKAWRDLANAESEPDLLRALSRFEARERDPMASESIRRLRSAVPPSYSRLADEMGYSYEQWRRRMRAATGVSPKFLHRYLRLQAATGLARSHPSMSMGEIAFRTGFDSDCRLAAESSAIAGRSFRSLSQEFTLPE